MSRKHNTKHNRSTSNYPNKRKNEPYPDYRLSDGRPASANRMGSSAKDNKGTNASR